MTIQASGSRHSMGYIPETVYGTIPATPAFKALRHNSTTLNLTKNTFQSNEIRGDRMTANMRSGAQNIGGNIVGELSSGSYDDFLEAALAGTWTTNVLKAGIVRRSFTIERHFNDIGQFLRYKGVEIDTLALTADTTKIVDLTFGVMGQAMIEDTVIVTGATYPAALTSSPMDALTGAVTEGGTAIAVVTAVSFNLNNGMQPRQVIGGGGISLEPSIGRSTLTGQMTAYFESTVLMDKFINNTLSSLQFTCSAGTSSYAFLLPNIKYTGGTVDVSGEGPVSIVMPFTALLDPATSTNLQITRVP